MFRAITFELRLARDILHGGKALARNIATRVEPRFSSVLEELKHLPKFWLALFQLGLTAMIAADREAVLRAEIALRRARRGERDARDLRDSTKSRLFDLLIKARSFLEGAVKRGASKALVGLDPNLPQEAIVLLRYGTESAEELSESGFQPSTLVVEGEVFTPQEYARKIERATEDLQAAEELLADQVRVTEEKLKLKERAVKKLSKENGCCARIHEELYVLAGEEFHAERLRKSSRLRSAALAPEPDPAVVDAHFEGEPLPLTAFSEDGEALPGDPAEVDASVADSPPDVE